MSEKHPISSGKEHPSLDVVQRFFRTRKLEPQQTGQQAERDGLHPVQSAEHLWTCFVEVSLDQHLQRAERITVVISTRYLQDV